ncbi:MAG: hypothetical protein JNJ54_01565 [Myxococcaceae bacterium]|nr:hypothetical protein [Myxococcaceae bacterium]
MRPLVGAVLVLAACGAPTVGLDGGSDPGDAGAVMADAGSLADAGSASDAGALSDAGSVFDAGSVIDAGALASDGGATSEDAGSVLDAGLLDGGALSEDAGSVLDAGLVNDGGVLPVSDGGALSEDAGSVLDAGPSDGGVLGDGGAAQDAGGSPVDSGAADAGPFVDACASQMAACPAMPSITEGGGLRAINRCAFPMGLAAGSFGNTALLDALALRTTPVTVAQLVADTNRVATQTTMAPGNPPGLAYAFRWNMEDDTSTTWIPQGITGSADATASGLWAGRRVVLVSWYEDAGLQKGVRIAFVDVTTPSAPRYRFALLVQPTGTPAAPSFTQVDAHAGGMVWFGSYLYMAQTGSGFRVFDLTRVMQVATDLDVMGCTATTCRAGLYKYVLPQVAAYTDLSSCNPLFSWVSLDRASSPPALVSGEYCSGTACSAPLAGRVFHWPLDAATGRLRGATTWPTFAAYMGHRQVQGGAFRAGVTWLSSSAPPAGAGALYTVNATRGLTSQFIDAPEDLMVDEANGVLWSQSEGAGDRVVVAVRFTSYPLP